MENNGIWQEHITLPSYLVDPRRKATLASICLLLQEVAGNHAHYHNFGYHNMLQKEQLWVLNRLRLDMEELPVWRQTVEIRTWVSHFKGPFSFRHFNIFDEGNRSLGRATTLWALIDARSRKPVRIEAGGFPLLPQPEFKGNPAGKLPSCENGQYFTSHTVSYFDLDMVGHVNNVKYLEWVMDPLLSRSPDRNFLQMEANYLEETQIGETIEIYQTDTLFSLENRAGIEVCRIRLE